MVDNWVGVSLTSPFIMRRAYPISARDESRLDRRKEEPVSSPRVRDVKRLQKLFLPVKFRFLPPILPVPVLSLVRFDVTSGVLVSVILFSRRAVRRDRIAIGRDDAVPQTETFVGFLLKVEKQVRVRFFRRLSERLRHESRVSRVELLA